METDRLIRRQEAYALSGLTRYMLDLLEAAGDFPKRVHVGQRGVRWSRDEVAAFIERAKERRAADGSRSLLAEQSQSGDRP